MNPVAVSPRALGVTIAICCHNSAKRLPETLGQLLGQRVAPDIPWEVLVIDNGSTDETEQVARRCWPSPAPTPLRVVREEKVGLSCARRRGFIEAAHEIVCFVDDDNWLGPEWVEIASALMSAHPDVAVCGGDSVAVFEGNKPAWFDQYAGSFAVGRQGANRGYHARGFWGAGLTVRKSAWERLNAGGFEHLLTDRQGEKLSSGGDTELCIALKRLGWKQWYEPDLRLQHYIPRSRALWKHLRRLHREFGAASVVLTAYHDPPDNWKTRLGGSWLGHVPAALRRLFRYRRKFWRALRSPMESDPEVIELEHAFGRLVGLWRCYGHWTKNLRRVQVVEEKVKQHRQLSGTGPRAGSPYVFSRSESRRRL
jgi:glycosyltransferase involved in cell wall biosynthesis